MSVHTSGFVTLGLSNPLLKSIETSGYTIPTPIQQESIPALLQGRNLIAQAKTGSGKTAAFVLPLLQRLDFQERTTQVLILTPTRELAQQVAIACQTYAKFLSECKVAAIYGGDGFVHQKNMLKSQAKIIVGTTGRIIDHIERGNFNPATLKAVVLDEADEMLRMGFLDDVNFILKMITNTCQLALFSATMPRSIQELAATYLTNPHHINIESQQDSPSTIDQYFITVNTRNKVNVLTHLLEMENISGAIIFVRTRRMAIELTEILQGNGMKCTTLHGELTQKDRELTVSAFKNHKYDAIIATDIAARGLDIERISLVVNYDMPGDDESYIHRIGRTGRAGRAGKAIALVTANEMYKLRNLERRFKITIQRFSLPDKETLRALRIKMFATQLAAIQQQSHTNFAEIAQHICTELSIEPQQLTQLLLAQINQQRPFDPASLPDFKEMAGADRSRGRECRDHGRWNRANSRDRDGRDHDARSRSGKSKNFADQGMRSYRLDVGTKHNVKVGNIVGAIANEAGIANRYIGKIKLFNDYCVVDLPDSMTNENLHQLQNTRVCGRKLNIAVV